MSGALDPGKVVTPEDLRRLGYSIAGETTAIYVPDVEVDTLGNDEYEDRCA